MTDIAMTLAEPAGVSGSARVLFFGRTADVYGRSVTVEIPSRGCALDDLRARIADQVDGAAAVLAEPYVRVVIDPAMTHGDAWVSPGQELAFLSAFSGG